MTKLLKYMQLMCCSMFLLLAAPSVLAKPATNEPIAKVSWIKGNLKVIKIDNKQQTLQSGSLIYLHDTLVTDSVSKAQIVYTDNSLLTLRPNTKFRIDEYVYQSKIAKKKPGVGKYVTTLIEGGFRTITGAIAKDHPENYQVNTPVATIGVRGTDYEAVLFNGELALAYYKGSPCVTSGSQTLCLSNKTPYAVVPDKPNAKPVPLKTAPEPLREKTEVKPAKYDTTRSAPSAEKTGSQTTEPATATEEATTTEKTTSEQAGTASSSDSSQTGTTSGSSTESSASSSSTSSSNSTSNNVEQFDLTPYTTDQSSISSSTTQTNSQLDKPQTMQSITAPSNSFCITQ